jgi:hypothetical protein
MTATHRPCLPIPSGSPIFANLELVPRAVDLDHILDQWKPDLVVQEMAELAAPLVCTTHAIRYVDVSFGPLIPAALLRAAGTAAAPHWRARGQQPDTFAGPASPPLRRHLSTRPPEPRDRFRPGHRADAPGGRPTR